MYWNVFCITIHATNTLVIHIYIFFSQYKHYKMVYLLDTLKVLKCTTCPVRALLSKAPSLSPRLLLCLQHLPSRE